MKTHNSKLAELKAAIQKTVPEIMRLEFGCSVVAGNAGDDYVLTIVGIDKGRYDCVTEWDEYRTYNYTLLEDEFKILGRPIGLPDVLILVYEKYKDHIIKEIYIKCVTKTAMQILGTWNLYKNLDGQSEETIDFLHNLLVTK